MLSPAHRLTAEDSKLTGERAEHDAATAARALLQEFQTDFAVSCIRHLWSTRKAAVPCRGSWRVLLVGHSMGGVVARAALARLAAEPGFGMRPPSACFIFQTFP